MTTTHRTYQFRVNLRRSQHRRLDEVLTMSCRLYNAALQHRRDAWKHSRESVTYFDQSRELTLIRQDDERYAALDRRLALGVLRRVDRAFKAFYRRAQTGEKPGYPRFKPRRRFRTIELGNTEARHLKVRPDGRKAFITIKGISRLSVPLRRPLPPTEQLRSLRLVKRPSGWYVDLSYEVQINELPPSTAAVGIDVGVNNRLTLSTGETVENRHVDRSREIELRRAVERSTNRDSRGRVSGPQSNRRRKRLDTLARETRRNHVRNRNAVHQVTTDLVRHFGRIAVEDLAITNMTRSARGTVEEPGRNVAAKSALNRRISQQTWGLLLQQLEYKAESAGRELVRVDPRNTSKMCSRCGDMTPQEEYRTHTCRTCGVSLDRDFNAAINILSRAFGPTRQEGRRELVRTRKAVAA